MTKTYKQGPNKTDLKLGIGCRCLLGVLVLGTITGHVNFRWADLGLHLLFHSIHTACASHGRQTEDLLLSYTLIGGTFEPSGVLRKKTFCSPCVRRKNPTLKAWNVEAQTIWKTYSFLIHIQPHHVWDSREVFRQSHVLKKKSSQSSSRTFKINWFCHATNQTNKKKGVLTANSVEFQVNLFPMNFSQICKTESPCIKSSPFGCIILLNQTPSKTTCGWLPPQRNSSQGWATQGKRCPEKDRWGVSLYLEDHPS